MLLGVLVGLCALAVAVLFLVLPAESSAEMRAPFWGVNFAHRGLHTEDRATPENSLAAFTAAVDAGYGIELDVQLSREGEVVVFHDDTLQRVCGADGKVEDHTLEELRGFRLFDTQQGIPTLWETLYVVKGRVPLLVELKRGARNRQLCEATWKIVRTYEGDVCFQSFDPRIVGWFKRHVPGALRGQLAATPKALGGLGGFLVGNGLSHFWGRPHFIAHEKGRMAPLMHLARRFAMRLVWTARPGDDPEALEDKNEAVIFEFYEPEPRFAPPPETPGSWPEDEDYRF
ncbi:MAG: glycerophosphodiester phosphodiesterase family protein [Oscillospiraceae bacterium]